MKPRISIVMPVYNVEKYLQDSLECIRTQSYKNFECICVDDGSSDSSPEILRAFSRMDKRFRYVPQPNHGAGHARNTGLNLAKGEYVIFLDGDDLFAKELLQKAYECIVHNNADIVAFDFTTFDVYGNVVDRKGIHDEWLEERKAVFNYRDCPSSIMSIINPTPWNKMYRKSFLDRIGTKFEEISSSNDITFAAVTVAKAESIAYLHEKLLSYRIGHDGTITQTKTKKLNNSITAIESALEQVKRLDYYDEIKESAIRFAIDNYIVTWKRYVPDIHAEAAREFYEHMRDYFIEVSPNVTPNCFNNDLTYRNYKAIKACEYSQYVKYKDEEIIGSLTSYPARIEFAAKAIESILDQSVSLDKIILWLYCEDFPSGNEDLPEDLKDLLQDERFEIRYCDEDLKPHKKYYYAFLEFPESIIITFDDDLIYRNNLVEELICSYMCYPDAITAARAHMILLDSRNEFLPYSDWIKDIKGIERPSHRLLATGGAGCLYPKGLYRKAFLNKEYLKKLALRQDDLWMKIIELEEDIPVVIAGDYGNLKYVENSQESALCKSNISIGNDVAWNMLLNYADEKYVENCATERIISSDDNVIEIVTGYYQNLLIREREREKATLNQLVEKDARVNHLENSYSYRIGLALTFLPRKLVHAIRGH